MALIRALSAMMPRLAAEERLMAMRVGVAGSSVSIAAADVKREFADLEAIVQPRRRRRRTAMDPAALQAMGIDVVMEAV